jgi:hypothetical protein
MGEPTWFDKILNFIFIIISEIVEWFYNLIPQKKTRDKGE